jgi:hypothetical protein
MREAVAAAEPERRETRRHGVDARREPGIRPCRAGEAQRGLLGRRGRLPVDMVGERHAGGAASSLSPSS